MVKSRLKAFSDGVIAIIITIMVLELKPPHAPTIEALQPLIPVFLSHALSFLYVGIYWNNHHHLLQAARRMRGSILWTNPHLLFWLSLIPFATAYMDENHYFSVPTVLYGVVLFMAAVAYLILQQLIIKSEGADSIVKRADGSAWKDKFSPLAYHTAIALEPWSSWLSQALFMGAALVWLIPNRRIEHQFSEREYTS